MSIKFTYEGQEYEFTGTYRRVQYGDYYLKYGPVGAVHKATYADENEGNMRAIRNFCTDADDARAVGIPVTSAA